MATLQPEHDGADTKRGREKIQGRMHREDYPALLGRRLKSESVALLQYPFRLVQLRPHYLGKPTIEELRTRR